VTPALSPAVALCRMCIHRDVTGALKLLSSYSLPRSMIARVVITFNTCNVFSIMLYCIGRRMNVQATPRQNVSETKQKEYIKWY